MGSLDNANAAYLSNVKNISSAFSPVNSPALQSAVGPDGSFANSLGFGDGGGIDVTGLSPEALQSIINNRSQLFNQNLGAIKGAIDLNKLATDNEVNKSAALKANSDVYNQQANYQRDMDVVNQHLEANKTLAQFENQLPTSPTEQAKLKNATEVANTHVAGMLKEGAARDAKAIQIAQMQIDAGRFDKKDSVALQDIKDKTAARTTLANYLSKKDANKEDAQVAAGVASQYPDLTDGYTFTHHTNFLGLGSKLVSQPMPTVPVTLKDGRTIQAIQRGDGSYYVPTWANQGK